MTLSREWKTREFRQAVMAMSTGPLARPQVAQKRLEWEPGKARKRIRRALTK